MSDEFLDLARFTILKQLGSGAFGDVYQAFDKNSKAFCAVKISKQEIYSKNKDYLINFTREVNIISKVTYPSILQFIGFSPTNFNNKAYPVIVTEYMSSGSLQDAIESKLTDKGWNDTKALINIYGIASAMSFLHSHQVLHRDLKPANILLDNNLYPKLADFGLSKISSNSETNDTLGIKSDSGDSKGTPVYMAPEIIKDSVYLPESDVYAFSIIVYQLITKVVNPYNMRNKYQLLYKVGNEQLRPQFKTPISEVYKNLITKCWDDTPEERPTFDDILVQLRTNPNFITDEIDRNEYFDYIKMIQNSKIEFNEDKRIFRTNYYLKDEKEAIEKYSDVLASIEIEQLQDDDEIDGQNITLDETNQDDEMSSKYDDCESPVKTPTKQETPSKSDHHESPLETPTKQETPSKSDHHESPLETPKDQETSKQSTEQEEEKELSENPSSTSSFTSSMKKSQSEYRPKLRLPDEDVYKQRDAYMSISFKKMKNSLFPMSDFARLSQDGQLLVQEAERSPLHMYYVGRSLIEGIDGFPHKPDVGLKYIKKSMDLECSESLVYYCNLLISGTCVPKDVEMAKKLLKKFRIKNGDVFNLHGKILRDENNFQEAIKLFVKASKEANNESMFELAKIFLFGLGGTPKSASKANEYFEMARNNGNQKSELFQSAFDQLSEKSGFIDLPGEIQILIIDAFIESRNEVVLNELKLNYERTSFICSHHVLDSIEFTNFLCAIEKVTIELMYPSAVFPRAFSILKRKKPANVTLEVVVSGHSTEEHKIAYNDVVDSIILQPSVKEINKFSFVSCSSLKRVEIPSSVSTISEHAFFRCPKLSEIKIPPTVKSLGSSVFSNCYSLTEISLPPATDVIRECLFFCCCLLNEIKIPSSVTSIEDAAFFGCSSIKTIEIPYSVRSIGDNVFNGCSSLTKVSIPSSVSSIGCSAFAFCTSLESIEIPSSVNSFSEALFCGCKSLKSAKIPENSPSIEEDVFFGCSSLFDLTIPPAVASIGVAALAGCKSLKKLVIPSAVKSIGVSAFKECAGLNEVELPESLVRIDSYAFEGCKSLKKLEIPVNTKEIDVGAFYGCTSLEEISLPSLLADYGSVFGLNDQIKIIEI